MMAVRLDPWQNIVGVGWGGSPSVIVMKWSNPGIIGDWTISLQMSSPFTGDTELNKYIGTSRTVAGRTFIERDGVRYMQTFIADSDPDVAAVIFLKNLYDLYGPDVQINIKRWIYTQAADGGYTISGNTELYYGPDVTVSPSFDAPWYLAVDNFSRVETIAETYNITVATTPGDASFGSKWAPTTAINFASKGASLFRPGFSGNPNFDY